MTVLHRIVSLIITLLTIDSATTTGIAIFQFSGVLVSALAAGCMVGPIFRGRWHQAVGVAASISGLGAAEFPTPRRSCAGRGQCCGPGFASVSATEML